MSNNPFLRNKVNNNNNNRFNLLNDEQPVNNNKHFNENRGKRDYNNRDNKYNNNYNNRYTNKLDDNRFKSITLEQPKLDVDSIKSFPTLTLVNNKESDTIIQLSSKFKDILNNVIEDNTIDNSNIILPGWLQLTMLNGTILKKEYKEVKVVEEEQEELNYNMYKIGNALQTNYEIYEKVYDSINGEGSYDTNFRLSPVYGSEYDSNSSSESESQENIDHDDEY